MVLEIISVYFYRNKRLIFDNFNLKLQKSQIMILIGDNGVGKTTLFDLIVGILDPTKGDIKINNKRTCELFENKRELFTYLPHKDALKDNLTVMENIENWLYVSNNHFTKQDIINNLEYFNLAQIKNIKVEHLSHGQKKKLSLSKLLLSRNSLWLLDEPFNGLDKKSFLKVKTLIERHTKSGGSVLLSSHIDVKIIKSKRTDLNKLSEKGVKNIYKFNTWEEIQ
tara:strand:- start:182 stop:853 length:672 start_codon:yes stop_codon:yes gene_type:complete